MAEASALIIACGALAKEIVELKRLNGWSHLEIQCLPANLHNRPEKIPGAVRAELEKRRSGLPERPYAPESQSPWQEIFREKVEPFSKGMVLRGAPDYQDIARTKGVPRDNH